jgi:stage V sporulation protein R
MNEGWACMIHEKILNALRLPDEYYLSFIKLHNQVVRPHLGRVNPYHLGFKIFKHIEKERGFEECIRIRETCNDETFIKSYLNQELCNELNLFSFSYDNTQGVNRIRNISNQEGWQTVRDDLIKNVGLNSAPVVLVKELRKDGTLILEHQHDGRDIELSEANKVFEHINDLWGGEVKFTTIIEDDTWEF